MRICFPSAGNRGESEKIYSHFGSAPFFTIYDTEEKKYSIVENDNQHHVHGTCQPVNIIKKYDIDIIMTSGMGRRAVEILNSKMIKIYLLDEGSVSEAVNKFNAGKLKELTIDNACNTHNCK